MMQANELRICNWVNVAYTSGLKPRQIEANVLNDKLYLSVIQPIPLTEEILLKCGTKQNDSILLILDCDWLYFKLVWNGEGYELHIAQGNFYGSDIVIDCTYLHTLQNIVHSLTNEELNIKL